MSPATFATAAAVVIPIQASRPGSGGESSSPTPRELVAVEQNLFTGWYVVHRSTGAVEDFVALSDDEAQQPGYARSLERVYGRSEWRLVRVFGPRVQELDGSSC